MADALEKEMQNYFTQLNEAEKKSVILMLKTFLFGRTKKTLKTVEIEDYSKEIYEAIARVEAGDFYTQAEMEKMSKDW